MRPKALDLFCGAGGASMGLHRAGFEVVGIDIRSQPRYPFTFIRGDALRLPLDLKAFDFIWASPPCQAFTSSAHWVRARGQAYPNHIEAVRNLLASGGKPAVIENVPGAPIRADLVLDGTMFPDLKVVRRRHFETNFRSPFALGFQAFDVIRKGWTVVTGNMGRKKGYPVEVGAWHTIAAARKAMGIDWMTAKELSQAIPPAYAEFIGRAALRYIGREAA